MFLGVGLVIDNGGTLGVPYIINLIKPNARKIITTIRGSECVDNYGANSKGVRVKLKGINSRLLFSGCYLAAGRTKWEMVRRGNFTAPVMIIVDGVTS